MNVDWVIREFDVAVRSVAGSMPAARRSPGEAIAQRDDDLDAAQKQLSAALMRVNHVGEVCAQALYQAQALSTDDEVLRAKFRVAAMEERDHLAWTAQRLGELNARPSLFNPLWYAGAFAIGLVAGRLGDKVSLGFVAETERQVEEHLHGHLDRLPANDLRSRAIVAQMKTDEIVHAENAVADGGVDLPGPVRALMRVAARVMTSTAHHV